jgi:hypothetical protein
MKDPAASGEVSLKDKIYFIVASDGVLDPQGCNNMDIDTSAPSLYLPWCPKMFFCPFI